MFIWMHALKKAQAFQRMFCKMMNNLVAWCMKRERIVRKAGCKNGI